MTPNAPVGVEISRWWDKRTRCWEFRASIRMDARFTVTSDYAEVDPAFRERAEAQVLRGILDEAEKLTSEIGQALKP